MQSHTITDPNYGGIVVLSIIFYAILCLKDTLKFPSRLKGLKGSRLNI